MLPNDGERKNGTTMNDGTSALREGLQSIVDGADAKVVERGRGYARRGKVVQLRIDAPFVRALVAGSEPEPYECLVRVDGSGITDAFCTCAYAGDACKHLVASAVAALDPALIASVPAPVSPAKRRRRASAAARSPRPSNATTVRARSSGPALPPFDAVATRRTVRRIVRSLQRLRPSVAYWRVGEVIAQLEPILAEAQARASAGASAVAYEQLAALTDAYQDAWLHLDDSDGLVGGFAIDLGKAWCRLLLDAPLECALRAKYLTSLQAWANAYGDYGVDTFGAAVVAARDGWSAAESPELVAIALELLDERGDDEPYLDLALRGGRVDAYALRRIRRGEYDLALNGLEGHDIGSRGVLAVAQALVAAEETERGLRYALDAVRREPMRDVAVWTARTAETSGFRDLALAAAEIAFECHPDLEQYRRVERLAGAAFPERREHMLERVRMGGPAEAQNAIAILLETGAIDDVRRRFEAEPHSIDERTVRRVMLTAARSGEAEWTAAATLGLAQRAVEQGRARYDNAARWLRLTAFAYRCAGCNDQWQAYRNEFLSRHRAKRALVPLVAAIP